MTQKSRTRRSQPTPSSAVLFRGLLLLAVLTTASQAARAEDVLWVGAKDDESPSQLVGEIQDYTGREILFTQKLPTGPGRPLRIPRERLVRMTTTWPASYEDAEENYQAHRYAEALPLYRQALADDMRTWARREILARLVRCYHNLGEIERAGETFLLIYRSDPTTHHLAEMPLAWKPGRVAPALEQAASAWLQSDRGSASRLMGASWLLSGGRRLEATQALNQLLTDQDRRIVMLANTQLWRTQLVRVAEKELPAWQQQIEVMPPALRAGPYYLLGQALARHQQPEDAVLAWMRVPIHEPHAVELASESLLAAASQLETMGRVEASKTLLREAVTRYPDTAIASAARQKLEQLESAP